MVRRSESADRGAYISVATIEEAPLVTASRAVVHSQLSPAPSEGYPSPAKTVCVHTGQVKKWQTFPGKTKFFCDGRLMMSEQSGVFYLTCGLIVVTSSLFFAFDCRYLAGRISPAVPVAAVVLFVFVMSALFRTAFSDPGIIPRAMQDEWEQTERRIDQSPDGVYRPPPRIREVVINGQLVKLKYCFTCKIFRPPRSSHCSVCDNCVERFDHHCPWVGNCIGRRNYRYFYLFLVFLSLHCTVILCFSVTTLVLRSLNSDFVTALKESPTSLLEAVIAFLSIWSVFGLAGFHTYLAVCNVTTNEDIKKTSGQENLVVNYSQDSLCRNYCEVVCGPMPPSLIDRRGLAYVDVSEGPVLNVAERQKTSLTYATWSEQNPTTRPPPGAAVYAWGTPDEPPEGHSSWNNCNNVTTRELCQTGNNHETPHDGITRIPMTSMSNGSISTNETRPEVTENTRVSTSPSVYMSPMSNLVSPNIMSPSISAYMTPSVSMLSDGQSVNLTSPVSLVSVYATPSASLTPVTYPDASQSAGSDVCMAGSVVENRAVAL